MRASTLPDFGMIWCAGKNGPETGFPLASDGPPRPDHQAIDTLDGVPVAQGAIAPDSTARWRNRS